ncbi:GFA family protein [Propylenella binzhouense]|uniref:GFA family protein n=1 Tax=Propylenella binzhouense TaxID=2555902 RepID=A0A964T154_9HYPH|nr:GFA family protein [Propylenella binzhouense]MYZ46508.1 GFA family protein [Propylenella binzhouense]
MAEATMHAGGCHCGRVRFEAKTDLGTLISCNCSICSKKGLMLTFVPDGDFRLVSGYDFLVDYQFNKHVIHHLSCARCGVEPFARGKAPDGSPMVAINVRCLDDVDVATLEPTPFNGRDA